MRKSLLALLLILVAAEGNAIGAGPNLAGEAPGSAARRARR